MIIDSLAGLATYPVTNGHGDIVGTTDILGLFTANAVADEFGRGEPPANRLGWLGNYQRAAPPALACTSSVWQVRLSWHDCGRTLIRSGRPLVG